MALYLAFASLQPEKEHIEWNHPLNPRFLSWKL